MPFASIRRRTVPLAVSLLTALSAGCDDGGSGGSSSDIYSFANGCFTIAGSDGALARTASGSEFAASTAAATPFFFKASGLGTYLLYDDQRGFLVSDGTKLLRTSRLESDITTINDGFRSEAEWELQASPEDRSRFRLRHRKSGGFVAGAVIADAAAASDLEVTPAEGCSDFPEEGTFANGRPTRGKFPDGDLFGFTDMHSHILANYGFGGAGIFHGAPFHPLGVEHALGSCERFHGREGRKDLFGAGYDLGLSLSLNDLIQVFLRKELPTANHRTDGYPTFSDWPNGPTSSTHQVQYYKWLERAYLGGLRLVVLHAVNNQMICDLLGNGGFQPIRYACNDMVGVDRQVDEAYRMQDYIDAQEGGPGQGWFRIVTTPDAARDVIGDGKMAVILGIETSNLFDCFLTPREGYPRCTEADVRDRLEEYYQRGVRVLFPVHKFDNGFSAGDGQKGFLELGNFTQTSNFSSFTTDCDESVPTTFDRGRMSFPGLNEPRDDYFATPGQDLSTFYENPLNTLAPYLTRLTAPGNPNESEHCKTHGLTALGEFLLREMAAKGMIIELDHLPRKAYKRAFEIIQELDYPAVGTHGLDNFGKLYQLGGLSTSGFGRCRDASQRSTVDNGFQSRLQTMKDNGAYPGLGFGLDLNGFAGAQGPRFGPRGCSTPQTDPLTYPFTSFAGDVTFDQPKVGNRSLDFNTEGLVHIGMLPDMIEDVRRDGVTDEEIEPLFRSAEAYVRVWERAERRSEEIRKSAD